MKNMKKTLFSIFCIIISSITMACSFSEASVNGNLNEETTSSVLPENDLMISTNYFELSDEEAEVIKHQVASKSIVATPSFYENELYKTLNDEQKKIVMAIESQIVNYPDSLVLVDASVTDAEAYEAIWKTFYSNPQWFWLISDVGLYSNRNKVYTIDFYTVECDTAKFNRVMDEIVNKANCYATTAEKIVYLHDTICQKVVYDYDKTNLAFNQTTYSFVTGKTVCAGYARALSYLMNRCGLTDNYQVLSVDSAHSFNYVKLDGRWYIVDACWDDGNTISRNWLFIGSKTAKTQDRNRYHDPEYNYPTISTSNHSIPTLKKVTATPTPTKKPTSTPVPTKAPTNTPTNTPTPTKVPTNTPTPTKVPTNTPTPTKVPTNTPTPTKVPTNTPTPTKVPTNTPTPTVTSMPSPTPVPFTTISGQMYDVPVTTFQGTISYRNRTEDSVELKISFNLKMAKEGYNPYSQNVYVSYDGGTTSFIALPWGAWDIRYQSNQEKNYASESGWFKVTGLNSGTASVTLKMTTVQRNYWGTDVAYLGCWHTDWTFKVAIPVFENAVNSGTVDPF